MEIVKQRPDNLQLPKVPWIKAANASTTLIGAAAFFAGVYYFGAYKYDQQQRLQASIPNVVSTNSGENARRVLADYQFKIDRLRFDSSITDLEFQILANRLLVETDAAQTTWMLYEGANIARRRLVQKEDDIKLNGPENQLIAGFALGGFALALRRQLKQFLQFMN